MNQRPKMAVNAAAGINPFTTKPDTENSFKLSQMRRDSGPSLRPNSVLIACIGNYWAPGCWQAVVDMWATTHNNGIGCWLEEMVDQCHVAGDLGGLMRTAAVMRAMDAGFEWVFMVENDVMVPPDLLLRLLRHDRPLLSPFLEDMENGSHLQDGLILKRTGLARAQWASITAMLFKTRIFNGVGVDFFGQSMWAAEGFLFNKFRHYGHELWVDSDTIVPVVRSPWRPTTHTWAEQQEHQQIMWDSRAKLRDRAPVLSNTPGTFDGVYAPFLDARVMEKMKGGSDVNSKP